MNDIIYTTASQAEYAQANLPAISVTASNTVAANTSNAAALPAVAGKYNYITGFEVTCQPGSSIGAGVVTLTGITSGTASYQFYGPTNQAGILNVEFTDPIPSSAANTAITVTCPALGASSGASSVVVHGFVL
jgi:hypothetical protein